MATEFLLIAATLVELKAKRLLPGYDDIDLDEELALWEERDLLLARLLECKTFKDAAVVAAGPGRRTPPARTRAWRASRTPSSTWRPTSSPASSPPTCARPTCGPPPPSRCSRVELEHVAPIRISVTDAVEELLDELPRAGRLTFRRLTESLVEKLEVVVRFLAVLELYKQGLVDLDQPGNFGELTITWIGGDGDFGDGALDHRRGRHRRLRRMTAR